MTEIIQAKRAFYKALEAQLATFRKDIEAIAGDLRESAKDTVGLNKLAQNFNGVASTMEHALTQVEETREEARKWLGLDREPITERVNEELVGKLRLSSSGCSISAQPASITIGGIGGGA